MKIDRCPEPRPGEPAKTNRDFRGSVGEHWKQSQDREDWACLGSVLPLNFLRLPGCSTLQHHKAPRIHEFNSQGFPQNSKYPNMRYLPKTTVTISNLETLNTLCLVFSNSSGHAEAGGLASWFRRGCSGRRVAETEIWEPPHKSAART